ncbi:EamA family transporter [Chamaesiphon sp. VAR_48_metabat_135_sub]|jgi:bacterial/archaeal transporter family protein|uniref:EamA family transporter n=1 Tax=Chamaesiphon sp. VAR_48_metabat_135_sub TaxID=2964699 RepID=UPI00286BDBF6|nr:EamA family transporter [Chamaesiphon sp. VAR_48_metabat_135_sub]
MENSSNLWWIYALLSAFFAALTTIFAKIGIENIDANLATALRTVVIVLMAWGIVLAQGNLSQLATVSSRTLIFLVISGIATGCSWIFYFQALQLGKAAQVAPIDKSSVVMVILFSTIFLHEPLTLKVILGGCLIVLGTLVLVL